MGEDSAPAARPGRPLTLADVRARRVALNEIGRRHGVHNIRVFGSVARGEADEDSDLDLLVDVLPGHGLLALGAFAVEVEETMHVLTQVATIEGLGPRLRRRVGAEAVPV